MALLLCWRDFSAAISAACEVTVDLTDCSSLQISCRDFIVGSDTSLAFGPDGQPAISYYDDSNSDLKFARFNGNSWSRTTVDSAGNVGIHTSLAFGPDGQPAISYYDGSNLDLKFARMGIFTPRP